MSNPYHGFSFKSEVKDWCQNCGAETEHGKVYCDPCAETLQALGVWEGDGKDNEVATE